MIVQNIGTFGKGGQWKTSKKYRKTALTLPSLRRPAIALSVGHQAFVAERRESVPVFAYGALHGS